MEMRGRAFSPLFKTKRLFIHRNIHSLYIKAENIRGLYKKNE